MWNIFTHGEVRQAFYYLLFAIILWKHETLWKVVQISQTQFVETILRYHEILMLIMGFSFQVLMNILKTVPLLLVYKRE